MKKYALLVLRNGGNRVIAETTAPTQEAAIGEFNRMVTLTGHEPDLTAEQPLNLDVNGYRKIGDITYCIAEYFC